jgi:glycosyltransferase involved in cell wall biosynthesis
MAEKRGMRAASGRVIRRRSKPESQLRPRVLIVAAHDSLGGAARAIYRVFEALSASSPSKYDIQLRVIHNLRDDDRVVGGKPKRNRREYAEYFLRTRFRKYFPRKPFISDNQLLHSQALFATGLGREINASNPDLVMLGWLGNATLSIKEIGKIKAPLIFRLSDMWVFSGAEHYTDIPRYREGYSRKSRPKTERGPDIDRETFRRKLRYWSGKDMQLIALSDWLAKEARSSKLTRSWPVTTIPVPIDVDYWKPLPKGVCRSYFNLGSDEIVLLFGAGAGTRQPHKGAGLLLDSLQFVNELFDESSRRRLKLLIFGEDSEVAHVHGIPVSYIGRLDDDGLRNAYSAADLFIAPSRLEAFGQVAAEAQACGTPVVAFDNSGLADVIEDKFTGKLAEAFDVEDLARSIYWVLEDPQRTAYLGENARTRAVRLWHPNIVAKQYETVFDKILYP